MYNTMQPIFMVDPVLKQSLRGSRRPQSYKQCIQDSTDSKIIACKHVSPSTIQLDQPFFNSYSFKTGVHFRF